MINTWNYIITFYYKRGLILNKYLPLILIFACSLLHADEKVTVSKIRITVGKIEYLWNVDGVVRLDGEGGNEIIREYAVRSFMSIRPGMKLSEASLLDKCAGTRRRLLDSGYFYEADVAIVPPRTKPLERTVVVSLSTGFFKRFGGGNAWGKFGMANLGGHRQSLDIFFGYNKNGASYLFSNAGRSRFLAGGEFFYYGPGDLNGTLDYEKTENKFLVRAKAGFELFPDCTVVLEPTYEGFGFSSRGLFSLQPVFSLKKYINSGYQSCADFSVRGFCYPAEGALKAEESASVKYGISRYFQLALKESAGASFTDIPDNAGFDLYYAEDRSIRSGYSRRQLTADDFAFASFELRSDFLSFSVPPIIDATVQAFGFADIAKTKDDVLDAYGLGLRLLFKNPVFAYFTFSYGVNREGSGRFLFCGTAGF